MTEWTSAQIQVQESLRITGNDLYNLAVSELIMFWLQNINMKPKNSSHIFLSYWPFPVPFHLIITITVLTVTGTLISLEQFPKLVLGFVNSLPIQTTNMTSYSIVGYKRNICIYVLCKLCTHCDFTITFPENSDCVATSYSIIFHSIILLCTLHLCIHSVFQYCRFVTIWKPSDPYSYYLIPI
jgi:hypothetical protein